jgi:hypothetical protein
MSGITIEMLPDEPILLATYNNTFSFKEEGQIVQERVIAAFESASEPVFYIVDMREEPAFDFQEFLALTSQITRGQNALLHHPKMKENLIITQNNFFKVAARGLSADVFGGVKARIFDTLEEALAYARSA